MAEAATPLIRRLIDEPLTWFLLIGLIVFALDRSLSPVAGTAATAGPEEIFIPQARIDEWRDQFRRGNGRLPTRDEESRTTSQWIDEEVLYRQALQLGLYREDAIVRRQLIRKMDFLIEGASPLPPAGDAELEAFMHRHAATYGQGPRYSLQHVFLSRARHGAKLETEAIQALQNLRSAPEAFRDLGDPFPSGTEIRNASGEGLRKIFGKPFVDRFLELAETESAQWQGPVSSGFGLHLVRITGLKPFRPPVLAEVRDRVELDWRLQQQALARRRAPDALREQFTLRIGSFPEQTSTGDGAE